MSTPADDQSNESREVSGSSLAGIERSFLRLTFWQTLLSLAGVFTGAVALYAALNESQAVREQTAAAVWPYVQMMIEDTDNGTEARFALSLQNVGVGPARMGGMQLMLNDQPVSTWDHAVQQLLGKSYQLGVDYGRSSVSRRVIAPGESVYAFQTADRSIALAMQEAVYSGKAQLSYCFCSIFEQCWLTGPAGDSSGEDLASVDACPDFEDSAFRD